MSTLWSSQVKNDQLAFVMMVFPWGQDGTPLANFSGPRKWQREILREMAQHCRANNGKVDFKVFRKAVSSGRGIGKEIATLFAKEGAKARGGRGDHARFTQ